MKLGVGTVLRGNKADISGGFLLSEKSSADLQDSRFLDNWAVDGRGLASVNGSTIS